MKFDQYYLFARIFPAIICLCPLIVFNYFFLSIYLSEFLNEMANIKPISNISIPLVFMVLLSQINRLIGIEVFEKKYFGNELHMPTTSFLTHANDQYTDAYKEQIHRKILDDFDIQLSTKNEEENDEINARKRIVEAVSLIKNKVGSGKLLHQHNTEYGFLRNLLGGSVVALIISLINVYFFNAVFHNNVAFTISIFTTLAYTFPILLSKKLLVSYGNLYAKVLIQEYMSLSS